MMEQLIKVEIKNGVQVIDSRLVANGLEIQHKNLMETIRKYQEKLEKLGRVAFETESLETKGGKQDFVFCYLNELQCNFVVTLSRNTEAVVDFKLGLVVAFDQAKKEIKILEEVIQESADFLEKKKLYYQKKGYSDNWIAERLKSIEVRDDLESLWRSHGIDKTQQLAILTAVISKGLFGITPQEHKKVKGLKNQNLRDNMTLRELVFMSLAEISTHDFAEADNAQNYNDHKKAAEKGGQLAGVQRALYEKETGKKVLSSLNFLPENRAKYIKK
jgi:phage regulator Rha-like protein